MTLSASPFAGFFSDSQRSRAPHKPAFDTLPAQIVTDLCRLAGASRIIDAAQTSGGISASAAFVVTFDTGLRLFIKGSHPGDQSHGAANLRGECQAYRSIDLLADIAPQFCGMVSLDAGDDNGWWLGAWQALDITATRSFDAPALFHLLDQLAGCEVPASRGLPVASAHPYLSQFMTDTYKWKRVVSDAARSAQLAGCFVDSDAGADWLADHGAALVAAQKTAAGYAWRLGVMHGDARCDNFVQATAAAQPPRWYLLDWANAADGPIVFDRVMLAASLLAEGTLSAPAACTQATAGLSREEACAMAVMQAGYFADQIYRQPVASMPSLRPLQKAMFWGLARLLAEWGQCRPLPALKV